MRDARYLPPRTRPLVPAATPLAQTLQTHDTLRALGQLAQRSQERLRTVQSLVPTALHPQLQAGGLDDEGWTLLVRGAAAAAKLRQLQPMLQAQLQQRHGPGLLRIKRWVGD